MVIITILLGILGFRININMINCILTHQRMNLFKKKDLAYSGINVKAVVQQLD